MSMIIEVLGLVFSLSLKVFQRCRCNVACDSVAQHVWISSWWSVCI